MAVTAPPKMVGVGARQLITSTEQNDEIDTAAIAQRRDTRPTMQRVWGWCMRCYGAPGRTRTADAHLRTVPLYPTELRGRDLHRSGTRFAGSRASLA